jgi:hypothetical protein
MHPNRVCGQAQHSDSLLLPHSIKQKRREVYAEAGNG